MRVKSGVGNSRGRLTGKVLVGRRGMEGEGAIDVGSV